MPRATGAIHRKVDRWPKRCERAFNRMLAASGSTPMQLQHAIEKDLKSHSVVLTGSAISLHAQNSSRRQSGSWNVAGLLAGSDPKLVPETVLISAHPDHDGECDGKIWHGADDNACGTLGVVTLAHALAGSPVKPRRSILFVVFAAVKRGLLGAFYMAAHPLRPLDTTRAMINFDMIGHDETPDAQTDGLIQAAADTGNRLNLIGAAYSPDYRQTVAKQNQQAALLLDDRFDHECALNVCFRSDRFPFVLHNCRRSAGSPASTRTSTTRAMRPTRSTIRRWQRFSGWRIRTPRRRRRSHAAALRFPSRGRG